MTDDDFAHLAHLNQIELMQHSAELAAGGATGLAHGAAMARLGVPLPFLNVVLPVEAVTDGAALIDAAEQFFTGHAAGYVVFTREGDARDQPLRDECSARGFFFQERYPEMVCDGPLPEPELPAGCELRLVEDERGAAAYWDLCDQAYPSLGFPEGTFSAFPAAFLLEERTRAFIAYKDGQPVACAFGWLDDGVTFIGWVATVDAARRTGLGALITTRATNDGFERGARFASLQASPMGFRVYQRMGYREVANYQIYGRVFEQG